MMEGMTRHLILRKGAGVGKGNRSEPVIAVLGGRPGGLNWATIREEDLGSMIEVDQTTRRATCLHVTVRKRG